MPKNTSAGFIIAIFSGIFGFAMVWHMWLPAIVGLVGAVVTVIFQMFMVSSSVLNHGNAIIEDN